MSPSDQPETLRLDSKPATLSPSTPFVFTFHTIMSQNLTFKTRLTWQAGQSPLSLFMSDNLNCTGPHFYRIIPMKDPIALPTLCVITLLIERISEKLVEAPEWLQRELSHEHIFCQMTMWEMLPLARWPHGVHITGVSYPKIFHRRLSLWGLSVIFMGSQLN